MNIVPSSAMSLAFLGYMNSTLLKEGGEEYTNDPTDHGGATKWGVTEARARASGYTGDMRDLTHDQALSIYWTFFWIQPGLDKIDKVDSAISATMLDLGVNNGSGWPGKWVQRGLNVLNQGGTVYPDLTVDGNVGLMTAAALGALKKQRGAEGMRVLDHMLHAFAAVRYVELAEANPDQERFEFGWLSQRAFPK